ncbi:MAG: hypothetical protein Q8O52_01640, partial [Sulfuritalea sp.]|nr:hypothetical protein [Sulfuritalea sp.]
MKFSAAWSMCWALGIALADDFSEFERIHPKLQQVPRCPKHCQDKLKNCLPNFGVSRSPCGIGQGACISSAPRRSSASVQEFGDGFGSVHGSVLSFLKNRSTRIRVGEFWHFWRLSSEWLN